MEQGKKTASVTQKGLGSSEWVASGNLWVTAVASKYGSGDMRHIETC